MWEHDAYRLSRIEHFLQKNGLVLYLFPERKLRVNFDKQQKKDIQEVACYTHWDSADSEGEFPQVLARMGPKCSPCQVGIIPQSDRKLGYCVSFVSGGPGVCDNCVHTNLCVKYTISPFPLFH